MKIKIVLFVIIALFLGLGAYFFISYYYVFGEGVKSGELNYVVKKGYIFKTYEGKMIQNGFKSGPNNGAIQSNEFIFSIEDEKVAEDFMQMGNRTVDLYYKEYFNALPWRGNSVYVVDSFIVKIDNISLNKNELVMKVGDKTKLNAAVYPEDSYHKSISWSSDNTAVATVTTDGLISAVASGETIIHATVENKTANCIVIVEE